MNVVPLFSFPKHKYKDAEEKKKSQESETLADFIRIKPSVFCGLRFSLFFLFI